MLRDAHAHTRIGAVGNHRLDISGIKAHLLIEDGILLTFQRFPICQRLVPFFPFRSVLTSLDVCKGGFVRSHHTAARTHLYTEITQSEASFHRQTAHSLSGILHKVARSTAGCHFGHHIERHILGSDALAQPAVHRNTHRFGTRLKDTLRSQHHLHLACADAESHRPHGAMSRSMRITAHNRHTRQSQSAFRTHHMDNAVFLIHHAEMLQTEIFRILSQRIHLRLRNSILDRFILIVRRRIVVGHTEYLFRTETFKTSGTQSGKSLRAGYFMAVKPVYVKLRGAVLNLLHNVGIPNFIK